MNGICLLILVEIVIFSTYNVYVLYHWGIPRNISATYYNLERTHKHYGLFLPLNFFICCSIVIPIWINSCNMVAPQGQCFTWCAYLTCFCMVAVGITCRYKRSRMLAIYHYAAAITGAACTILWIIVVCYRILFVGLSILLIALLAGFLTHTLKKSYLYWLELPAFYALFFVLFIINLMNTCL